MCPAYQGFAQKQAERFCELQTAMMVLFCCGARMAPSGRSVHPSFGALAEERVCSVCRRTVLIEPMMEF